jgi:hypothetical protein
MNKRDAAWIQRIRELRQGLEVGCDCSNEAHDRGGCFACCRLVRDDRLAKKHGLPVVKTLRPKWRRMT